METIWQMLDSLLTLFALQILKIPKDKLTLYRNIIFVTNLKENPLSDLMKSEYENTENCENKFDKLKEKINKMNSINEIDKSLTDDEVDLIFSNFDEYVNLIFQRFFK